MFGDSFLSWMWTRLLQTRIERGRCSFQRFQSHRTGNISDSRESFRPQDRQSSNGVHGLSAIEQSKPFFCFEMLGLQSGATKCFPALKSFALKKRFAFAHQAQSEVGKWSKVATGADRTFFRNNRTDPAVEHSTKHLDDLKTDPAESESEHVGAKQHHGAHFGLQKRA